MASQDILLDYLVQAYNQRLLSNANQHIPPLTTYRTLYCVIRDGILLGALAPDTKLPSSRLLASRLGMARNTVLMAFDHLVAEAYVYSKAASGMYVVDTRPMMAKPKAKDHIQTQQAQLAVLNQASHTHAQFSGWLSQRGQQLAGFFDANYGALRGAFAPGIPDLQAFPYAIWQRCYGRYLKNPIVSWQGYPNNGQCESLQQQIAWHLNATRGMACDASQIVITHGTQSSLQLIAQLLADVDETVWMEEPGYRSAYRAFKQAGLQVKGQPVDAEGCYVDIQAWQSLPKFLYVTPSHQYPTGVIMSAARRRQLLADAIANHTWLIEDDYDSEFRYGGEPLTPMQALAPQQVIYLGTFSKTCFPALRLGYMVLPFSLVDIFRQGQSLLQGTPSYVLQHAFADFMLEGHYTTHVRSMLKRYRTRRDLLVDCWQRFYGDDAILQGMDSGLHGIAYLPVGIDANRVQQTALAEGMLIRRLDQYKFTADQNRPSQNRPSTKSAVQHAILLGFGDVPESDIERSSQRLFQIMASH